MVVAAVDALRADPERHVIASRTRVAAERRRGSEEVDPVSARRIVEEFLAAASSGRTDRLVALLTDDVTAGPDGAGLARRRSEPGAPVIDAW